MIYRTGATGDSAQKKGPFGPCLVVRTALGKDDRQALDDYKEREERKRNKKAPFPFSLTLPFLYLLKNKEKERRERKAGGHRRGDLKGGT